MQNMNSSKPKVTESDSVPLIISILCPFIPAFLYMKFKINFFTGKSLIFCQKPHFFVAAEGSPNWPYGLYIFCIVVFLIQLSAPVSAQGKIYTWRDQNGVKQFSNIGYPRSENQKIRSFYETTPNKILPLKRLLSVSLKSHGEFKVLKIYDGDTIKVKGYNNLIIVVRFAGIDAPETRKKNYPGQPYGEKAKKMVENLISDKKVILKTYGTGGYNRILAEIFTKKGININLELIRKGLAEVYRGRVPEGFDISPYLEAEAAAKRSNRGIWSLGSQYESPRQWRREHPWKR